MSNIEKLRNILSQYVQDENLHVTYVLFHSNTQLIVSYLDSGGNYHKLEYDRSGKFRTLD